MPADAQDPPETLDCDGGGNLTDDQIVDLLHRIREGAEVGKLIAGMRPAPEAFANHLILWIDLLRANISVNTAVSAEPFAIAQDARRSADTTPNTGEPDDDVDAAAWRLVPGTPAEADLRQWRQDGWPEDLLQPYRDQDDGPALRFGHRILDAALDNLQGAALLIADASTTRPAVALSRVVLDAAAHLHHVLRPGLDAEERIVRLLNESLSRLGDDYQSARRDHDLKGMSDAETEIDAIFAAVGPRRTTHWKDKRGNPYLGMRRPYTSAMIVDLIGQSDSWSQLSDVVHNKEGDGWRILLGQSLGIENPHMASQLAMQCFAAVLGIVKLTESICTYTGWDLAATVDENDALLQNWSAGVGMLDEVFRQQAEEQRRRDGSTEELNEFFARFAEAKAAGLLDD